MDKKKTLIKRSLLAVCIFLAMGLPIVAQEVGKVQFCDRTYSTDMGNDSITLYLKFLDTDDQHIKTLNTRNIEDYLEIKEDGKPIPKGRSEVNSLNEGRIPADYTFSVLVDLNISGDEMEGVYDAVGDLVKSAPDSSVYLSFFGDDVSASEMVTKRNYDRYHDRFFDGAKRKLIYDALYVKLLEFSNRSQDLLEEGKVMNIVSSDYRKNKHIAQRAVNAKEKNILFVFTEGIQPPTSLSLWGIDVEDAVKFLKEEHDVVPGIHSYYYTADRPIDDNVESMLEKITYDTKSSGSSFYPSAKQSEILEKFGDVVEDAKYDYAFTYKVADDAIYTGKVSYDAYWDDVEAGHADYSIGTEENPWPNRKEPTSDFLVKLFWAVLITLLTIAFFFCILKVLIPFIKSKTFAAKYYKDYRPEAGIQKRLCHYCKQPILPGQKVVTKCKHVMHVHCWQQNGYQCAEYGQNCKTGIQEHVDLPALFTKASFRDCHQAISGILAGFVSWIVYELIGRGMLNSFSASIASLFLDTEKLRSTLLGVATTKVSSFIAIGLLLGFFLSLVFRYNDEYRKKSAAIYMKIIGLSALSAFIGMMSFVVGGVILCMLLSSLDVTSIPWYCSLPAYLLFSVCTALSLTIKSTIPIKSAMIGGLCSAVIGFLVLYFSEFSGKYNMLLDFVIYGGGLGASLVTVRMLAEKYFLVIMNGEKQGTRIPIHKWMNATGGGNKVSIGMTGDCEIQMNWDKSNRVAKEHVVLYIDQARTVPVIKPLATGVNYNSRAELPVSKPAVLTNSDTFQIGDTIFQYVETD